MKTRGRSVSLPGSHPTDWPQIGNRRNWCKLKKHSRIHSKTLIWNHTQASLKDLFKISLSSQQNNQ